MRWISRAVLGWNVRMTVGGRRTSRFFGDAAHGGEVPALRAARAYRDVLAAARPPAVTPGPRPLVVVRGDQTYVQVRLPKAGGGTATTEFSTARHGVRRATRLALDAHSAAVARAGAN